MPGKREGAGALIEHAGARELRSWCLSFVCVCVFWLRLVLSTLSPLSLCHLCYPPPHPPPFSFLYIMCLTFTELSHFYYYFLYIFSLLLEGSYGFLLSFWGVSSSCSFPCELCCVIDVFPAVHSRQQTCCILSPSFTFSSTHTKRAVCACVIMCCHAASVVAVSVAVWRSMSSFYFSPVFFVFFFLLWGHTFHLPFRFSHLLHLVTPLCARLSDSSRCALFICVHVHVHVHVCVCVFARKEGPFR